MRNGTGWLRAFDDPNNRAIRVLDTMEIEVEPWPDSVELSAIENGGRDGGLVRTKGDPASMRAMWEEHGLALRTACDRFDVPLVWAMGMAGIEAVRGHGMRWDSQSYRYEMRIDDFSAGIMQTLSKTAEGERKKRCPEIPAFKIGGRLLEREDHPLFDHEVSALLGVGYMRTQLDRYGMRPLLCCAGYNAGKPKPSDENEFGVRTYGPTRPIKFIAYVNDAAAVLRELGELHA
jgi:hypothetical protein